jgi:hypothetical protein
VIDLCPPLPFGSLSDLAVSPENHRFTSKAIDLCPPLPFGSLSDLAVSPALVHSPPYLLDESGGLFYH